MLTNVSYAEKPAHKRTVLPLPDNEEQMPWQQEGKQSGRNTEN